MPINRRAVVSRHDPRVVAWNPLAPLSVGNGEFAFTADITGLQTFSARHERSAGSPEHPVMPLGTQAQWAFHWAPNPEGWDLDDTDIVFSGPRGKFPYPARYDFLLDQEQSADAGMQAGYYFWTNPQRLHLGRIALHLPSRADGRAVQPEDLSDVDQHLDLWTGVLRSTFTLDGNRFEVTTACHPTRDALAVRVVSGTIESGDVAVRLDFAHVASTFDAEPVWNAPDTHDTHFTQNAASSRLVRTLDNASYVVDLELSDGGVLERSAPHEFRATLLPGHGDALEFVVSFTRSGVEELPDFASVVRESSEHWASWWMTGAAVDLSESTDPRAGELERRIVLSQYQTAINCSGSTPPQETGLVCNSWGGTFHLEMHWWHAAHFASWGRPAMLERSLGWYESILPVARKTAQKHGLDGAQWPKHVGPEGIESPNMIGPLLVWQQPHPIHYAELLRSAHADPAVILARFGDLVDETARCIASMLTVDHAGVPHLAPPLVPAQEVYEPDSVWDPVFEIAYFRWALDIANAWRLARGLDLDRNWSTLSRGLVPPVSAEGDYAAVQNPPRTSYRDHPSMTAAFGVVPPSGAVDPQAMRVTLDRVAARWEWSSAWGWDFPMLAMCAARLGDRDRAFEFLVQDAQKNSYLANGHNYQDSRLPLYLPGNGGLLMAIAVLAAEQTDMPDRTVPQGQMPWSLQAEGFSEPVRSGPERFSQSS